MSALARAPGRVETPGTRTDDVEDPVTAPRRADRGRLAVTGPGRRRSHASPLGGVTDRATVGPLAQGADEGLPAGPRVPGHAPPASTDPRWPTRRIFGAAFTAGTAVVLAYVLLNAVGRVAGVLLLIVLALVFALGLDPVVRWLIRHGLRRIYGVAVVTGAFLLVLAGVAAAIVPPIVTQIGELVRGGLRR